MSTEPEKKSPLLAPLAAEYEPTGADAERVLARIKASLAGSAAARSSAASSGLAASAQPTASAGPAASVEPAGSHAPPGMSGGKKALLFGVSCAAIAILGVLSSRTGDPAPVTPPHPQVEAPSTSAPPLVEPHAPEAMPAIPSVSIDALPTVAAQPAATPAPKTVGSALPAASAPPADTLEREARILAEARRARQAGESDRAIALLDEHAREFPEGWLASDRAAERIVVLCALGRREEAVGEAAVFLKGRPKSPLTRRIETSCAGQH